jgi:hypothetical protein
VFDRRLRELERRWRTERDAESEVALIQALLRGGRLPRPRLLLAAYLGSEGAARQLGGQGFPEETNLRAWVTGLGKGRLGRSPELAKASAARAAVAAFDLLARHDRLPTEDQGTLDAVRAWLEAPSDEAAARARAAGREAGKLGKALAKVLAARAPEAAARAAGGLVQEAARALRGVERHHLRYTRQALYDVLLPWALGCAD